MHHRAPGSPRSGHRGRDDPCRRRVRGEARRARRRSLPALGPQARERRLRFLRDGADVPEGRLSADPCGASESAEGMGAARDHAPDDQEARRSRGSAGRGCCPPARRSAT
jgi:hypothetical protein